MEDISLEQIIAQIRAKDPEDFSRYIDYEDDLIAVIKYYYYEKLNWCGCGNPGDAMRTILRYLNALKEHEIETRAEKFKSAFDVDRIYDSSLLTCLAYAIDAAGFTEHGSSIYWPWLTKDGEYFCWAIEEAEKREELDI